MTPDEVTPGEAVRIARLPMDRTNEREIIRRLAVLLDTAIRDMERLQKLGTISPETHSHASNSLTSIAADLANIRR